MSEKPLAGKVALITGSYRNLGAVTAETFASYGAKVILNDLPNPNLYEARDVVLAQVRAHGVEAVAIPADLSKSDEVRRLCREAIQAFGKVDILVHAIAFANREDLLGAYYTVSRAGFHLAMDISVFSFVALAKAFQPFMRRGGALLTLTYYGSVKVAPNYNMMGVAKAALEASTRYLARDFGPQGIRVNAISAGPVRTLAAMGVSGFRDMHKNFAEMAPLRENITIEDCGNAAVYLCSDWAAHVTGEIHYVDSGYNIMAAPEPNVAKEQKGE